MLANFVIPNVGLRVKVKGCKLFILGSTDGPKRYFCYVWYKAVADLCSFKLVSARLPRVL